MTEPIAHAFDIRYLGAPTHETRPGACRQIGLCAWGMSEVEVAAWLLELPTLEGRLRWHIVRDREARGCEMVIHVVGASRVADQSFCWPRACASGRPSSQRPEFVLYAGNADTLPALRAGCWFLAGARPVSEALVLLAHALVVPFAIDAEPLAGWLASLDLTCLVQHREAGEARQLLVDAWRSATVKPKLAVVCEARPSGAVDTALTDRLPLVRRTLTIEGDHAHAFIVIAFGSTPA